MEFLKELLGDELYGQVSTALKDKGVKIADLSKGDYVDKNKFSALEEKYKSADTQLKEANKQIEAFNGMDIEGVKAAASEWKTKFEQAESDYNAKFKKLQLEHALESRIAAEKPKNAKAVKALLDMEKISLDGENLIGFDDQFKTLKEENDFLFETKENGSPTFTTPGAGNGAQTQTDGIKFNFIGVRENPNK